MAVMTYPEKFDLALAQAIENCYLICPALVPQRDLMVRHIDPVAKDEKARRCSCEFVECHPRRG